MIKEILQLRLTNEYYFILIDKKKKIGIQI